MHALNIYIITTGLQYIYCRLLHADHIIDTGVGLNSINSAPQHSACLLANSHGCIQTSY